MQAFCNTYSDFRVEKTALITFGTKYLNKFIYTLVNLVLNTLQNLLSFYF